MLVDGATLPSWLWPVLAGPFVGSFLGVVVRRLPAGEPVIFARSACETCGRVLGPAELVPVLSYLYQRGRCGGCASRIAPAHLGIELAATLLPAWAVAANMRGPDLWAGCLFGWMLLALAWIDARHMRLPDVLTLPLLLAGLTVTAWLDPDALTEHALAAATGYGLFRLVAVVYRMARGRSGLGEGDAKLMAAIGVWVGMPGLAPTLLLGALLGLAFGVVQIRLRRMTRAMPMPFGPFLAGAAWLVRLYVS